MKLINICKSYDENIILDNLSLETKTGDLLYIKGINGSGKSTLLKIIAGITKPDSGEIVIDENEEIGALIENPGFIENETAEFNMKFLYNLKHHYDEKKVRELMHKFLLNPGNKQVSKYSVGMRQKLGIIQAVMEDQNLLLFDEPTRGLDEDSVRVFSDLVNEYAKNNKTVIICAHDGVDGIDFNRRMELRYGTLKDLAD